jgi:hypothetical protein
MERLEDAGEYGRTTLDELKVGRQIQLIYRPSEGLPLTSKPRIFDRFTLLSQFQIALQQVPVPVNRGLTNAEYPRVRPNLLIPKFPAIPPSLLSPEDRRKPSFKIRYEYSVEYQLKAMS